MQRKIIIGLLLTLTIVIFIPAYWVTEPGRQEAARERLKAEAMTRGAELYISSCALCHGTAGEGKVGPKLKGTQLGENALTKTISRGVFGKAMPAFGAEDGGSLKANQIEELITFILNWDQSLLAASSVPTPAPPPPSVPAPSPSPTAPAINAATIYARSCVACHGVNRQGTPNLGTALTPDRLAGRSDAEIRNTIAKGKAGTMMPPFSSTLTPEEIDALIQLIKYTSP